MADTVTDNLNSFEFHDACVKSAEYGENKLILCMDALNIRKGAEQNPHACDMQINDAHMIFENMMLEKYVQHPFTEHDISGRLIFTEKGLEYSGKEAEHLLQRALKRGFVINTILPAEQSICLTGMLSGPPEIRNEFPLFSLYIRFNSVSVKWQNFCAQAWYVRQNQEQYSLCITAPGQELAVKANLLVKGEKEDSPSRTVSIVVDGILYTSTTETTELALIDIANQLPDGYAIKSCLSCRHGNFCPVGNADNEVFCIKDFAPKQKSDLYEVTENDFERIKRRHLLFDLCTDYMPAVKGYYHYNDYLFLLNRHGV